MALDDKIAATRALLAQAAQDGPTALANSLSAEDMVLTHMIATQELAISVFTLDTGMLPPESLELIDAARDRWGLTIDVYRPDADAVAGYVAHRGSAYAFYESLEARKSCCAIRKVEPLGRALAGKRTWITGMRREQAESRAGLEPVEVDAARRMIKYNPLSDWGWDDVTAYAAAHDVPMNALYARGYVSIGCGPCTRALRPGEHPRTARWWWEQDSAGKECGLHVSPVREGAPA